MYADALDGVEHLRARREEALLHFRKELAQLRGAGEPGRACRMKDARSVRERGQGRKVCGTERRRTQVLGEERIAFLQLDLSSLELLERPAISRARCGCEDAVLREPSFLLERVDCRQRRVEHNSSKILCGRRERD